MADETQAHTRGAQVRVMVEREAGRKLAGRVEVDDAYLGGKHPGGKRGRGPENKVAFIAAVTTREAPQQIRLDRVETFSAETVTAWAERALTPGCGIVSDGLPAFRSLTAISTHKRLVTGGGAKSVTEPAFRWANTLLGNLKTALSGTCHAFHFDKYDHRYLAEYQYRFNRRDNLQTMLPRLLRAAATTSQRTEAWLKLPEYLC